MASITARNVSLDYPTWAGGSGRLQKTPAGSGRIGENATGERVIHAIDDLSLTLGDGDRVGLIGRNGSGKSTLLRLFAGIYQPSRGALDIRGRPEALFNASLGLRPEATGYRNILLRGLVRGLSREEIDRKLPDIAEFTELGDFLDLPIRTYSQGMIMRLLFATVTAFEPDIVLIDEWFGAGDQVFRKKAQARMDKMLEQASLVVMATHSPALMKTICKKAIWLDSGELKAFGPLSEVQEKFNASVQAAPSPAQ